MFIHGIDNTCNLSNGNACSGVYSFEVDQQAAAKSFVEQSGRTLVLVGENYNWTRHNRNIATFLESIMTGSNFSIGGNTSISTIDFTINGYNFTNSARGTSGAGLACDSNFDDYCFGDFAFFPASMTDSNIKSDVFVYLDVNDPYTYNLDLQILEYAQTNGAPVSSTYNLFEDQVTIAGRVDAGFTSNTVHHIYAFAVIPREHFSPSGTSNDYFYPNFIPTSVWSYGDVGVDYCLAVDTQSNCNSDYANAYKWHTKAFKNGSSSASVIHTSRFGWSDNNVPEGMSLWYQHR